MARVRLDEARVAYLEDRESEGLAKSTIQNDNTVLTRAVTLIGNIYCDSVRNSPHLTKYFSEAAKTRSSNTLGIDYCVLNRFFKWCLDNEKMGSNLRNPMAGRKAPKVRRRPWRGVSPQQIPELLKAAWTNHPRDGAMVGLALFLFGRATELTSLKWEQIDLDQGWVYYYRYKTDQDDTMPINKELDLILRKWRIYYEAETGPVRPDWYVIPRRSPAGFSMQEVPGLNNLRSRCDASLSKLLPETQLKMPWLQAQKALTAIGYPVRNSDGTSRREGMHTFRRSGAKAVYWQLVAEGDPNPILKIQSQLGHADEITTRRYIGEEVDRESRNKRFRGEYMLPSLFDNPKVAQFNADADAALVDAAADAEWITAGQAGYAATALRDVG